MSSIITYSAHVKPNSFLKVKELIKRYHLISIKFYCTDDGLTAEVIRNTVAAVPKNEIDAISGMIHEYMCANDLEYMCFDNEDGFIEITERTEGATANVMPPINCLSPTEFKRLIGSNI